MKLTQVLIALSALALTTVQATFFIDSAILGSLAAPLLLYGGSLSTLGTGALIAYLKGKPRSKQVIHVTPTEYHGHHGVPEVIHDVHIRTSAAEPVNYHSDPFGHPPLYPQDLAHPLQRSGYNNYYAVPYPVPEPLHYAHGPHYHY